MRIELLMNNLFFELKEMNKEKILKHLIEFKTISETENNSLITFVKKYLSSFDINCTVLPGTKNQSNLYARIGPDCEGGIFFSGHTDVVPVEGQNWLYNPFTTTETADKIYGRGTADMKGFLSIVLSLVPTIKKLKLKRPVHIMFSYDEEIGCVGIKKAIPFIQQMKRKPRYCIVGEPTNMNLVTKHKGKKNFKVTFNGIESHSSLINDGLNAITYAAQFINYLQSVQIELQKKKYLDDNFDPPFTSINVGTINGGIALNIVPKKCEIEFEIRDLPNVCTSNLIKNLKQYIKKTEVEMKKINKKAKIDFKIEDSFPGLNTHQNKSIVSIGLNALKTNKISTVSFGTEAGVFHKLGIETIICGPGSITQAHKANEFVKKNQLQQCELFLKNIIRSLEY